MFFLKFCHFFRAKLVQKVKNYVFHLNYYETEKIKKTKLVWHQILHYVTHLFQNLTNFDRDITKSRISSFSTFSNFCPIVFWMRKIQWNSSNGQFHCFHYVRKRAPCWKDLFLMETRETKMHFSQCLPIEWPKRGIPWESRRPEVSENVVVF